MRRSKPIIGVTGPSRGGTAAWLFTKLGVWMQGGKAVRITPEKSYDIDKLDGLIIGGGADVNPEYYGKQRKSEIETEFSEQKTLRTYMLRIATILLYPLVLGIRKFFSTESHKLDKDRDEMELYYLERAIEKQLPILGICRGAQLINVKMGGSLYQDIGGFYEEIPQVHSILPKKEVKVDPQSKLAHILQTEEVTVNALHNQAVSELAGPLKAVAREHSGIVQAIEISDRPFFIGVQWHPEYMPQISYQRRLFRALVNAAKTTGEANS